MEVAVAAVLEIPVAERVKTTPSIATQVPEDSRPYPAQRRSERAAGGAAHCPQRFSSTTGDTLMRILLSLSIRALSRPKPPGGLDANLDPSYS